MITISWWALVITYIIVGSIGYLICGLLMMNDEVCEDFQETLSAINDINKNDEDCFDKIMNRLDATNESNKVEDISDEKIQERFKELENQLIELEKSARHL